MFSKRDYFTLLEVRKGSRYLKYFLTFYATEVKKFLPDFTYNEAETQHVFFILRNLVPAGLVITQPREGDELFVKLDFVIPGYRDFKVGRFVYSPDSKLFKKGGIRKIYTEPGTPKHEAYLLRMGFVQERATGDRILYARTIT